jgi:hypothetical protein
MKMSTIYFEPAGPIIQYLDKTLHVADLNPHIETKWRMGRLELIVMGLRCILAAFSWRV